MTITTHVVTVVHLRPFGCAFNLFTVPNLINKKLKKIDGRSLNTHLSTNKSNMILEGS
jgi:hypothetical protein